jgi:hypothetical protein
MVKCKSGACKFANSFGKPYCPYHAMYIHLQNKLRYLKGADRVPLVEEKATLMQYQHRKEDYNIMVNAAPAAGVATLVVEEEHDETDDGDTTVSDIIDMEVDFDTDVDVDDDDDEQQWSLDEVDITVTPPHAEEEEEKEKDPRLSIIDGLAMEEVFNQDAAVQDVQQSNVTAPLPSSPPPPPPADLPTQHKLSMEQLQEKLVEPKEIVDAFGIYLRSSHQGRNAASNNLTWLKMLDVFAEFTAQSKNMGGKLSMVDLMQTDHQENYMSSGLVTTPSAKANVVTMLSKLKDYLDTHEKLASRSSLMNMKKTAEFEKRKRNRKEAGEMGNRYMSSALMMS